MMHKAAFILAISLLASSALAADNRIKTVPYEADEVVGIVGHSGIQSTIEFAPDERIENVAVGDSSAWQITPNRRGSVLFVKPLAPVSSTNMTVVTDKRTYLFDLSTGKKTAALLYALKFSYPDEPPPAQPPAAESDMVMASTSVGTTTATQPDRLNFEWKAKGYSKLRPERIFDDGTSLYLAWAKGNQLPAILTESEKGREAPLDYRVTDEYIIITPVPQNIVLRYGNKSAIAWTTAPLRSPIPATIQAPQPVLQGPVAIAANSAPAPMTAGNSGTQSQGVTASGQRLADANSVKAPSSADLLTDKLMDGNHDH